MRERFLFDNEPLCDKWDEDILNEQGFYSSDESYYLADEDFYQSFDERVWTSNVEDIDGGDNFADYCKEFFSLLEEEEYFDN